MLKKLLLLVVPVLLLAPVSLAQTPPPLGTYDIVKNGKKMVGVRMKFSGDPNTVLTARAEIKDPVLGWVQQTHWVTMVHMGAGLYFWTSNKPGSDTVGTTQWVPQPGGTGFFDSLNSLGDHFLFTPQ